MFDRGSELQAYSSFFKKRDQEGLGVAEDVMAPKGDFLLPIQDQRK